MSDKEERKQKPKIGISIGDVNGIGAEVIMKTFQDSRLCKQVTAIVYASNRVFTFYKKQLDLDFNFFHAKGLDNINPKRLNVINVWEEEVNIQPGTVVPENGKFAIQSLEKATSDLQNQLIDALVTAPINKDQMTSQGFAFPGHTEFLTEKGGVKESLMLLVHDQLRVGVVTGHIPVQEVANAITAEKIIKKLAILHHSLKHDFGIVKPKIAVLGLNPHAGENGQLGNEDRDIILPAIEKQKEQGHLVFGPFPADGFFGAKKHDQYDAILGMYHDQGLIPFKTLAFGNGVNYTAGLPFIRTSPDHGTGYDIAGKNQASPDSFRNALYLAADIWKNRGK